MSPTTNKTSMQTEQYIPYSIRNNITDPDLAGLLDYLEREMGWKIENYDDDDNLIEILCSSKYSEMKIQIDDYYVNINYDYPISDFSSYYEPWSDMSRDLFFLIYKGIFPSIRDLYSKK